MNFYNNQYLQVLLEFYHFKKKKNNEKIKIKKKKLKNSKREFQKIDKKSQLKCFKNVHLERLYIYIVLKQSKVYLMIFLPYFYILKHIHHDEYLLNEE